MGKLFCRCRLGLKEEKRRDNAFVIRWLDIQRNHRLPMQLYLKQRRLEKLPRHGRPLGSSTLRSLEQPNSLQTPSQPPGKKAPESLKIVNLSPLKNKINLKIETGCNKKPDQIPNVDVYFLYTNMSPEDAIR